MWHAAGVSTIPISANGTKSPAFKWAQWQVNLPGPGELDQWWANGQEYGLALIMGKVSGNLEMLELEGKVCDPESIQKIEAAAERLGVLDKWLQLMQHSYQEESPSGGLHWIYRVHDHPVPGNQKIARRPANAEELKENPKDKIKVLAETRGEGGYVIVAPTSGLCHPTGQQWTKLRGEYGQVVSLLWETRCLIHQAIREALDEPLPSNLPVPAMASSPNSSAGTGTHMWDEYDRQADFPTLLRERGWTPTRSGHDWTRPGKEPRDGISATLNHDGSNRLFVFSTSSGLDTDRYFTPFEFVAYSDFGGDIKQALRKLHIVPPEVRIEDATFLNEIQPAVPEVPKRFSFTDTGNSLRLADQQSVRGQFHFVHEIQQFLHWDGIKWSVDHDGSLVREWQKIAEQMSDSDDESLSKWGKASLAHSKIKAAIGLFQSVQGVTKSMSDFDSARHLLNLQNGTLNLKTGQLSAHSCENMITRTFNASYDPNADCPNWKTFMDQTIPDPKMREYVQRAAGYSLLGNGDQRSLFVLYGPSGSGKSTFLETLRTIFADYGVTAPAATFRAQRDNTPTNDLHTLRGKRFVVTSETAETTNFDEELLKRLTGRDTVQSRELYQKFQEWTPECVLWIATNHVPKLNSDDDAIWRRMKLIPLPNQVGRAEEIPDMARRVLVPEADGILNWLLAGLRAYLTDGLGEPETVALAAVSHRRQSDSVARFIDEGQIEGRFEFSETDVVGGPQLLRMYREWCRQNGERALGVRRFTNRVESLYPQLTLTDNGWRGLRTHVKVGLAGSLFG